MISALIFDYFGVVRRDGGLRGAYRALGGDPDVADKQFVDDTIAAANYGLVDSGEVFAQRLGVSLAEWKRAVGASDRNDPELLAWVEQLRTRYKTALLSNAGHHALQTFFTPTELEQYFDVAISSGDVGFAKPAPEIFLLMAERLGLAPEVCLMIDDQPLNCEGAQLAGMQAVQFMTFTQVRHDVAQLLGSV